MQTFPKMSFLLKLQCHCGMLCIFALSHRKFLCELSIEVCFILHAHSLLLKQHFMNKRANSHFLVWFSSLKWPNFGRRSCYPWSLVALHWWPMKVIQQRSFCTREFITLLDFARQLVMLQEVFTVKTLPGNAGALFSLTYYCEPDDKSWMSVIPLCLAEVLQSWQYHFRSSKRWFNKITRERRTRVIRGVIRPRDGKGFKSKTWRLPW